MKTFNNIIIAGLILTATAAYGQNEKIWINGTSRGIMHADGYTPEDPQLDTISPRSLESGHAMVDLGVNIQPNDQLWIQGMVRIRNDYGGFWGSGVTFDIRQLTINGVIGGFLKYKLGDIDLKLSPYTLYNHRNLVNQYNGVISSVALEQVQYDLFYFDDNTWRQQGAAMDFALLFNKYAQEASFNLFTTRVAAFDQGGFDRLYSGGNVSLLQSKHLTLGAQYVNMFDLQNTPTSTDLLSNPVVTANALITHQTSRGTMSAAIESGQSTMSWEGNAEAPILQDYFYDARLKADLKNGLVFEAGYRNVGPNFRSAGAQTMQINFNRFPQAFRRYGNDQRLRSFGMMDLFRDASLYRTQLMDGLLFYDPRYDNATPYGTATPNRRGFSLSAKHRDKGERFAVSSDSEFLNDVVGLGTDALKNYITTSVYGEIRVDKFMNLPKHKILISGRSGFQNTTRTGDQDFENVEFGLQFNLFNLTATIIGDLEFIAEFRTWSANGFEQLAFRNNFSQIIDFQEYRTDFHETMAGVGLQFNFSEKTHFRLFYQTYNWTDEAISNIPYSINSLTLFFTMNF
jgi:hypothetical protein